MFKKIFADMLLKHTKKTLSYDDLFDQALAQTSKISPGVKHDAAFISILKSLEAYEPAFSTLRLNFSVLNGRGRFTRFRNIPEQYIDAVNPYDWDGKEVDSLRAGLCEIKEKGFSNYVQRFIIADRAGVSPQH